MLKIGILFCVLLVKCYAFDLDDEVYERMPPLFALDEYHRCLLYNGTYCVIKTELFAEPDNQLMNMMISYTKSSRVKHYNHTYQNKGICLTTTCVDYIEGKDLKIDENRQEILEKCENLTTYSKYGIQAKVSNIYYCDTKETKVDKKDVIDWTVLVLIISLILVVLAATYYDKTLDEKSSAKLSYGERMLLCFSLKRNWDFLVAPVSQDPNVARLAGINFIRTCASFMMVLGHVVWIFVMGFMDNAHDFERSYTDYRYYVIYNGMIVVQIFFVLSGFLLVYNMEAASDVRRISIRAMPMILLRRVIRLAPPMAIAIALNATWVRFMNTGPLWKFYVHSMVSDCRRWWWSHLLFINNYLTDNTYCAVQTWHTAADTQVFIVAISLYLLVKPQARRLVTILAFIIGLVIPALHVYFQDLDAQMLKTPEMLRSLDDPNRYPYVFAHNNICGFLLGMVTAYKVYHWQKQGYTMNEKLTRFLYAVCIPTIVYCFNLGNLFHEEDYRTPLWIRMLWQGTHRLFISLPVAALLACMTVGPHIPDGVASMMRWPLFRVLGKLTYAVFLLHETFTPMVAGSKTALVHFDYLNLLIHQCGIVALTYLLSVPFYLMMEAPVTPLLKLILMKPKPEDDIVVQDPRKNFISDVIQYKIKKIKDDTSSEKEKEKELNDKRDNIMNELLENAARDDVKKTS
ncbi:nose resistant to fluoxetine protein 6-like [Plodia interpunctella]|uniref:nose resistant to fluoxetine protein 6-like n=1 Tax=Plodia interpunctella TaxID=58824 RepID=UPI00236851ED|nr:nose resistant to fluoxetine protein 6-like [Plodia interpunctella]